LLVSLLLFPKRLGELFLSFQGAPEPQAIFLLEVTIVEDETLLATRRTCFLRRFSIFPPVYSSRVFPPPPPPPTKNRSNDTVIGQTFQFPLLLAPDPHPPGVSVPLSSSIQLPPTHPHSHLFQFFFFLPPFLAGAPLCDLFRRCVSSLTVPFFPFMDLRLNIFP